ncbi:RibD family protein [Roseicitreum antarcticum]|uniref:Riboflavin-specific deaminase C-terminal domain-containing protein n=1 Tax=Roseicitreum antarcticum TaxID=564137 RepID=A0A1H2THE4_9RHOB|nr:RibD family protein [Roseicitreum antarcticum]SDW43383.1 riboflavin-specific deaminase C-terminal domain-containing protein [Roseicitreum antarcticum]
MQNVDVTDRVWEHLLAIRSGKACACCGGTWSAGERGALDLYAPLARRDLGPVVVAQIGQSLDGRVATVSGDASDVSGPDGHAHLHRMRALVDGVVIGIGTALHDNPRLTVRLCAGPSPARIVIDSKARLPDDAPVLRADGTRSIIVQGVDRPRPKHVEVLRLPLIDGKFKPETVLQVLRKAGLKSLLIEGGGITIAHFLDADELCRLQVAVSPLLIGSGPIALTRSIQQAKLADCLRPDTRVFGLGSDVVFDCGLTPAAHAATVPQHPARIGVS